MPIRGATQSLCFATSFHHYSQIRVVRHCDRTRGESAGHHQSVRARRGSCGYLVYAPTAAATCGHHQSSAKKEKHCKSIGQAWA
jgi:hypothetical protein